MQDLEVCFKNFDDVQSQIEILDGSTEQELERSEFEDLFYLEISKAKDIINNGSGSNSSVSVIPNNLNVNNNNQLNVKLPQLAIPEFNADTGCKSNKRNTKATQTLEAGKGKDIVPGVFPIHHESVRDNGHGASPEDGVDSGRRTTRSLGGLPGLSSSFLKCGEIPSRARWGQFDVRRYLLRVSLLFLQEIK
ncbi:hypothetical protein QE152_g11147 [Popillia japonica]|uniref:Uncharacterized protein n=1 Tax=Popillia japonica TaxID=7064 RepID=A0AAW1LSG1_POPJA